MRASRWIKRVGLMSDGVTVETAREASVRHFTDVVCFRFVSPLSTPQKRKTEWCYGRIRSGVTPASRRCTGVRPVEKPSDEISPKLRNLLRQDPSEKERGVPVGTDDGRWIRRVAPTLRDPSSAFYPLLRYLGGRFVGLENSASQRTVTERGGAGGADYRTYD